MERKFEREVTYVLYNCKIEIDKREARKIAEDVCKIGNLKIVGTEAFYKHEGGGISYYRIIEESFVGIDSWPEYKTIIVRVASCNPSTNFKKIEEYLKEKTKCEHVKTYGEEIPLKLSK